MNMRSRAVVISTNFHFYVTVF